MFGINIVADHDVGASIRSITNEELQHVYLFVQENPQQNRVTISW